MSEFLKANFEVKNEVKDKSVEVSGADKIAKDLKEKALSTLGGSMVYVDKDNLSWDPEEEK